MAHIEEKIKEFIAQQGVTVAGIAGPDRFRGARMPSLDLAYSMPGGRSIISLALPMDVPAIYDFLGKRSPAPHNFDQFLKYQKLFRIEENIAGYLRSLGFRAKALPLSADYRKLPYVFATRPFFSHRFGAIAAGIAGLGWSGNVMTTEYGAAQYLGTVVTDAAFASDPLMHPRHFIETRCRDCKRCARVCPSEMFDSSEEEHLLYNNELYSRGKRHGIDRCNISCFGLHSLSSDKKWSNWGLHWIDGWIREQPKKISKVRLVYTLLKKGLSTGDSEPRFNILRQLCFFLWPEDTVTKEVDGLESFPAEEGERYRVLADILHRVGVRGIDSYPIPVVCGHCAIICGPTPEETNRRYRTLMTSGIVVPGAEGMVKVDTFQDAARLRHGFPRKVSGLQKLQDMTASLLLWHRYYFGLDIISLYRAFLYRQGHKKEKKISN
ncbi:MAG: hypothetical protein JXO48_05910 [Deltaproteobacteria bacterium]|nr:hypothetical protein [Deltaproteobacteria bacterium]